MADIIELIFADHERIFLMQDALRETARCCGDSSGRTLASMWDRLRFLIETHADAVEEICCPVVFGSGSAVLAQLADVVADLNVIREAVSQTRFLPVGSAAWWRSVKDAFSGCVELFDCLESGVLACFGCQTDARLRQELGARWAAFTASRLRDRVPQAEHDGMACQLCTGPITICHWHVLDITRRAVFCACDSCHDVFTVLRMAR